MSLRAHVEQLKFEKRLENTINKMNQEGFINLQKQSENVVVVGVSTHEIVLLYAILVLVALIFLMNLWRLNNKFVKKRTLRRQGALSKSVADFLNV